jgi:hypothetical protein
MVEKTNKQPTRRSDTKALARFMQELSWLLSSYSHLDFKGLDALAKEAASAQTNRAPVRRTSTTDVQTLVGILPGLLIDEALFPSNEDISEFAFNTLGVDIPRWDKKSRFELIGRIVCTANSRQGPELSALVSALRKATANSAVRLQIGDQRQKGMSWNEVIQNLVNERSE